MVPLESCGESMSQVFPVLDISMCKFDEWKRLTSWRSFDLETLDVCNELVSAMVCEEGSLLRWSGLEVLG